MAVVTAQEYGSDINLFEGCLELNDRYYPGACDIPPASSKQEIHARYASWPNRLVYVTEVSQGHYLFFDKNFIEYEDPLDIDKDDCIPIP